jgi:hypothetical protein
VAGRNLDVAPAVVFIGDYSPSGHLLTRSKIEIQSVGLHIKTANNNSTTNNNANRYEKAIHNGFTVLLV